MGASLAGFSFAVNPDSVAWNYKVKMASHPTIGGKVIQLYGFTMSDLTITGSFGGPDPIGAQDNFFSFIKSIASDQSPKMGVEAGRPIQFLWPEQGWDFWVYITKLTQLGASVAVETSERKIAPQFSLTCFVYQDNGDILKTTTGISRGKFLERLTAGLGWQQTEYNGPESIEQVAERLGTTSIIDFAFETYGLLPSTVTTPLLNSGNTAATETSQTGGS